MNPMRIWHKICFRLRASFDLRPPLRKLWWIGQGAHFGLGTRVPRLEMMWPHQVAVGNHCRLEEDVFFKYDGIWQPGPSIVIGDRVFIGRGCEFNIRQRVVVGNDCLIASGCKFIDHDHGMSLNEPMNIQPNIEVEIILEDNVWLGVNVVLLKGVTIGSGAIVAAGAVVTKRIGPNEIWGGVPARKIKDRSSFITGNAQKVLKNA